MMEAISGRIGESGFADAEMQDMDSWDLEELHRTLHGKWQPLDLN